MSNKNIVNVLDYSVNNCKLYNELQNNCLDISSFPIMTNNYYKTNLYNIISKKYFGKASNSLFKFYFKGCDGFIQLFYWNASDIMKANIALWKYRRQYYQISSNDKCCSSHQMTPFGYQIYTNDKYVINNKYISIGNDFIIRDLEDIEIIKNYNPSWMSLSSSWLIVFYNTLRKKYSKNPFRFKIIEYWGNKINPQLKKIMELYFDCKITYIFGIEYLGVAYENINGDLEIIEDNIYVEINNNKVIISNFNNFSCPIIRYDTEYKGYIFNNKYLFIEVSSETSMISCQLDLIFEYAISEINKSNFNIIQRFSYHIEENNSVVLNLYILEDYLLWKTIINEKIHDILKELSCGFPIKIMFN